MGTDNVTRLVVVPPTPAYCFKDATRVCGASCMAFQAPPKGMETNRWAVCKTLTDSDRTAYYLKALSAVSDTIRVFIEDERRAQQPIPPRVL